MTNADVSVKIKSSWGLGNIEPLIRLINENPDKIIAGYSIPASMNLYFVTDNLLAMRTEQQIATWNLFKRMIQNDSTELYHSGHWFLTVEQLLTCASLLTRGVTPDLPCPSAWRGHLLANYIIIGPDELNSDLWSSSESGCLSEGNDNYVAHNIEEMARWV